MCVAHALADEVDTEAVDLSHPASAGNKMMSPGERVKFVSGNNKLVDVFVPSVERRQVNIDGSEFVLSMQCIHN